MFENLCPQNAESSDFVKDIIKKLTYDCRFKEWPVLRPAPRGTGRQHWAGGRQLGCHHVPRGFQNDAGGAIRGSADDTARRHECDSMKQQQGDKGKRFLEATKEHWRSAKVGKPLETSFKNQYDAQLSINAPETMQKDVPRGRQRRQ